VEDEDDEEVDENAFDLKGSVIYQPFNSTDNLRALSGKRNANVDEPGTLMRARTSSQLVDMAKDSVQEDQQRIADFIKQIKAGEVQTQTTSEFRARRLTYSVKTEDDMAPSTPVNPFGGGSPSIKADPGSGSRKQSTMRQVRTTIFASSEIGTVTEKPPPFPDSVLGTYSCHGIEPAHDDGETVHEKINQDRGCVVCPYNSKRNEALFMVLDGHGSEGDKVSEFVMRQVRSQKARHSFVLRSASPLCLHCLNVCFVGFLFFADRGIIREGRTPQHRPRSRTEELVRANQCCPAGDEDQLRHLGLHLRDRVCARQAPVRGERRRLPRRHGVQTLTRRDRSTCSCRGPRHARV
jgi:hypothetical protein